MLCSGYFLRISNEVVITPVLGRKDDFQFFTVTHTQQVAPYEYITIGCGTDKKIHLISMLYSSDASSL